MAVFFKSEKNAWSNLTILIHKLRTDSAATKFIQDSISSQNLAIKSLAKNNKTWLHEKNIQNRLCLNKDEFLPNKLQHLWSSNFSEQAPCAYERPINFSEFI